MERRFLKSDRANVVIVDMPGMDGPTTGTAVPMNGDDGPVSGTMVGYAALYYDGTPATEYEFLPDMIERIMPSAGKPNIDRGDDIRALFNHNSDLLLGRTTAGTLKVTSDATGLRYEISPSDTTTYRDVKEHIRLRNLQGSSFSFSVNDDQQNFFKQGTKVIREIFAFDELFDVGPVTYPAYSNTTAAMRSIDGSEEARKAVERWQAREQEARDRIFVAARARLVGAKL